MIKKQLMPNIIRYKNYSEKEFEILKAFEQYYGIYTTANNCWEFLALAQHSGLYTRLIDFTYNPFVALFFSLNIQKKTGNQYIIYAINKKDIQIIDNPVNYSPQFDNGVLYLDSAPFDVDRPFSDVLRHAFENIKDKNTIIALKPNYRNLRILVQQGLFLVPPVLKRQHLDSLFNGKIIKIVIDENIRLDALDYLIKLGYDEYHLMPDLDSLCKEINNRIDDNRK